MEVEFMADVQPVILHRFDADFQQIGDLFTGAILRDEFQDAALGGGQVLDLRLAQQQLLHRLADGFKPGA